MVVQLVWKIVAIALAKKATVYALGRVSHTCCWTECCNVAATQRGSCVLNNGALYDTMGE